MTKAWREQFLNELLKQAKMITEAAELSDHAASGEGPMLVAQFSTVVDGTGICTFETEILEAFEGEPEMETMVTLPLEIEDDDTFTEVTDAILNMNLYVPFGHFGYYYPSGQVYFRHLEFFDVNKPVEELATGVIEKYKKIAVIVGNVFGALERLATGESSFEEEVENGTLPAQE
ncbi:MAG: hypothetical protein IJT32_00590 [Lachnospiraceae bacterium]|nr:hypothetical protein [Lachnospiraceae bacterium]